MPEDLITLIRKHPKVLKLLHDNGIHFCAGCYLTLSADPERAAAYHGVPDIRRFVHAVRRLAAHEPTRRHSPGKHKHTSR